MVYTFDERIHFQADMIQWDKYRMKYRCYCCNKLIVKVYEHLQSQTHKENYERVKNEMYYNFT